MNNVGNTTQASEWSSAFAEPQSAETKAPAPKKRVAQDKPAPKAPEQPKMDPVVEELAASLLD